MPSTPSLVRTRTSVYSRFSTRRVENASGRRSGIAIVRASRAVTRPAIPGTRLTVEPTASRVKAVLLSVIGLERTGGGPQALHFVVEAGDLPAQQGDWHRSQRHDLVVEFAEVELVLQLHLAIG